MNEQRIDIKNITKKHVLHRFWRRSQTIFYKKILVIFIGKKGVSLIPVYKNKNFKIEFLNLEEQNNIENYKSFFDKYHQHQIIFLLDNREAVLSHRTIPVLQNILKVNPVEKYIVDKIDPQEIIAYDVHNILTNNGESWEATIAQTAYTSPFSILLEHVINNAMYYSGTYFLSLEFDQIIDELLKSKNDSQYKQYLQIFVCITKTSDIRICVRHKSNIIEEDVLEYPHDKSDQYVQGAIEQAISDKIISLKGYTDFLNTKILVVIFCCQKLKQLFEDTKLDDCALKVITRSDVSICRHQQESSFMDNSLVSLFNKNKAYIAYNNQLKAITRLELLNSLIFKPFMIIIIVLLSIIAMYKIQTINIRQEIDAINNKYYLISEQYSKIKTNHPTIKHIGKLAALYSFENLLQKKPIDPFSMINQIYSIKVDKISITHMDWRLLSDSDFDIDNSRIHIDVYIEYISDFKGYELYHEDGQSQAAMTNYLNQIKNILGDFNIDLDIKASDILVRNHNYVVPAAIAIEFFENSTKNGHL